MGCGAVLLTVKLVGVLRRASKSCKEDPRLLRNAKQFLSNYALRVFISVSERVLVK